MNKKLHDAIPVEDRRDIDDALKRVAIHVRPAGDVGVQIRVNDHDALPIDVKQLGRSRVRVILHVPAEAIAAVKNAAEGVELTLDLLNLSRGGARFLVDAIPVRKDGTPQ